MTSAETLVEFTGVVKDHQALRPLRVAELRVRRGEIVSVAGPDVVAAEVLVNLMTAAMRPDQGTVRLFGRDTEAIDDYEGWLAMLDGFGLLTERAVLLDQCSIAQNLALPLTISIDPVVLQRVRLARALALGPRLLVAEHPTASLPRPAVEPFARDLARIVAARNMGLLVISADRDFARMLGGTMLTHDARTGVLSRPGLLARLGLG